MIGRLPNAETRDHSSRQDELESESVTSNRKIPVARPATGQDEWEATRSVYDSGWLAQGPKVEAFEKSFAKRHGVKHAVATSSGTSGDAIRSTYRSSPENCAENATYAANPAAIATARASDTWSDRST